MNARPGTARRSARKRAPRRKREWFDDDSFWRDLHPHMFPEERFEAARKAVPAVLQLTRPRGRAVLDLCCGPGRFSIPFAKRRFRVTGVDRTRYLLAKARARSRKARVQVEWVRSDMRDFVRPGAFDLVLSMFTSFGYFDEKDEDVGVLRNIHASLRPGGACIIQLMGKEVLARIWQRSGVDVLADGAKLVQIREIYDDWTRIRNEWTLVRGSRAKTWRFHHTLYSGQELRERLREAGFSSVRLYGSLDGAPYDTKAVSLVAVARKSGRAARRAAAGRRPARRA